MCPCVSSPPLLHQQNFILWANEQCPFITGCVWLGTSHSLFEISSALNTFPDSLLKSTEGKKVKYSSEFWQHYVTQVRQVSTAGKGLQSINAWSHHLIIWILGKCGFCLEDLRSFSNHLQEFYSVSQHCSSDGSSWWGY